MKFEFSEEQEAMRAEARRMLSKECGGRVVRAVFESERLYDAPLWSAMCDLGWTGVAIPEEHGGLGAGYLELCVLAEELGRVLAPTPFSSSVCLAGEAISRAGYAKQKAAWAPRLAAGEAIGALALAEGPGARPWDRCETRVRADGKDLRLDGVKWPVTDGLAATLLVVSAIGPDGFGLYLVDPEEEGVRRTAEPSIDESRPLARLEFSNVVVQRLGCAGLAELEDVLNRAAVLIAFEQLGGAEACLHMAQAYAMDRRAFGRPIGSFQAIKHKLADMFARLELARSNCYFAAWALSTDDPGLAEAAACARLDASRVFFECAKECIQIHGGIGFTWDLDAHLYYRRAKHLGTVIGGTARWRETLIQALQRHDAVGAERAARVA